MMEGMRHRIRPQTLLSCRDLLRCLLLDLLGFSRDIRTSGPLCSMINGDSALL